MPGVAAICGRSMQLHPPGGTAADDAVGPVHFSVQDGSETTMTRQHSASSAGSAGSGSDTASSSLGNFEPKPGGGEAPSEDAAVAITEEGRQAAADDGTHQPVSEDDDYEPLRRPSSGGSALMGTDHRHEQQQQQQREEDDAYSHLSDIYQEAARAVLDVGLEMTDEDQDFFTREMRELAEDVALGGGEGEAAPATAAPAPAPVEHSNQADQTRDHVQARATGNAANANPASGGQSVVSDDRSVPSTIDVPHHRGTLDASASSRGLPDYQRTLLPSPVSRPRPAVRPPADPAALPALPGQARPAVATAANLHDDRGRGPHRDGGMSRTARFSNAGADGRSPTSPVASCRPALLPGAGAPGGTCVRAPPANVNSAASTRPTKFKVAPTCAFCASPGSDVRIGCANGCTYHARCLDLESVANDPRSVRTPRSTNGGGGGTRGGPRHDVRLASCPSCSGPAGGLSVLPLDFAEMDRLQAEAAARAARPAAAASSSSGGPSTAPALRPPPTAPPAHTGGARPPRHVAAYDPSVPRTGRWTAEEIAFRDELIGHFLEGNLPLGSGTKLSDFLPGLLKSKQSRLAKKMKNAKLSTKFFRPRLGRIPTASDASRLASLESSFLSSVSDPLERAELSFHMSREWRDHLASRCHALGVEFDGRDWLGSVDDMERRLASETNRHRMMQRRVLMGRALEEDAGPGTRDAGIFVDGGRGREEFDLVVERSVLNSAGSGTGRGAKRSAPAGVGPPGASEGADGISGNERNLRHAAPFLSGIAQYIERNAVPFEHVDVWVPSHVGSAAPRGSGAAKRQRTSSAEAASESGTGTGGGDDSPSFRLCYGGSVTVGAQVDPPEAGGTGRSPLTDEDKQNFALFGDYSEKFSFSNGCGLPGRIFKSGIPAWEQFVSKAPADLFERRGGAVQFGVKTALGVPVVSPNVGRVVLILYSKHDRPKDEALVGRMITDLRLMNPCARWRLVVDIDPDAPGNAVPPTSAPARPSSLCAPPAVGDAGAARVSPVLSAGAAGPSPPPVAPAAASVPAPAVPPPKPSGEDPRVRDLILLLGESIPSDLSTPLGRQLHGLMSLRLVLLKGQRTPEEDQLVETVLVLFESYKSASRPRDDIAILLARDFNFHLQHCQTLSLVYGRRPLAQCPLLMAPHQQPLYARAAAGGMAAAASFGSLGSLAAAGRLGPSIFAEQGRSLSPPDGGAR